jgi:hypothetical protein
MAVKLALLKSGEQVIADIMELVNENDDVVSLVFSNPYIVCLLTSELLMEGSVQLNNEEVEHKVSFSPWVVLSADKKMAVDSKWVVTVVEPHEWIKKSYEEKMSESVNETVSESSISEVENFEVIAEEING